MDPQSLPDQPHGPYRTPPAEAFIGYGRRRHLLLAALQDIQLGAWDARILDWLAHFCDTPTFLAILGMVQRARTAGTASTADRRPAASRAEALGLDLAEARRLCEQATPQPWTLSAGGRGEYVLGPHGPVWARDHTPNPADAALAVWARGAIPRLLTLLGRASGADR
jgi:hypothetical protein